MRFGTRRAFKSVVAAETASLLAWAAVANGDRVGALVFGGGCTAESPVKGGRHGALSFFRALAGIENAADDRASSDDIGETLARARRVARPGTLIIVISDFSMLRQPADRQLARLREHNDVLCVWVYDELEAAPPPPARYPVGDGRRTTTLDTRSNEVARALSHRFGAIEARVQSACGRTGAVLVRIPLRRRRPDRPARDPDRPGEPLAPYAAMNPADPLAALRDIHAPDPPAFWPPAPGWIAIACLVIAGAVAGMIVAARWWRRGRPSREALAGLRSLRARHGAGAPNREIAMELSMLVRRFALARHPREEVAGLVGERWIALARIDAAGTRRVGPHRPARRPVCTRVPLRARPAPSPPASTGSGAREPARALVRGGRRHVSRVRRSPGANPRCTSRSQPDSRQRIRSPDRDRERAGGRRAARISRHSSATSKSSDSRRARTSPSRTEPEACARSGSWSWRPDAPDGSRSDRCGSER